MTKDRDVSPMPPTPVEDDLALPPDVLDAWDAHEPPPGFAERVVAAWKTERSSQVLPWWKRRWVLPVMVPVLSAAVVLVVLSLSALVPAQGSVAARERQEVVVGRRAVVVAEAGAALEWDVGWSGTAVVHQSAGRAFYRVEKGGAFEVRTPGGNVQVQGTCFTVEVDEMKREGALKTKAMAFGAGSLLTAAVLVTVYEGRVLLAQENGGVELKAGEAGRAVTGQPPERVGVQDAALLKQQNDHLKQRQRVLAMELEDMQARLALIRDAQARGEDPVKAENQSLRDQLKRVQAQLEEEKAVRKDEDGEP